MKAIVLAVDADSSGAYDKKGYVTAIMKNPRALQLAQSDEPSLDEFGIVSAFASDQAMYSRSTRNTNPVILSQKLKKNISARSKFVSTKLKVLFGVAGQPKLKSKRHS